ncbi:hypothetical protein L3Y34_013044 [Caenorhabditis briggsae]|uniref:Uncharacterized protein n=1 Tax=Caenorhabditis briggsae TaxID=6238 RepID=A0AAE8ZQQ1_CAEBR|nr:hypothetical protein L3Y34_013044 [Caenorhabditis briggsae]
MEVPTLFKIALKKCIVYHCNARIKVNENVPSKLKQILFNGMMNSLNPVHPSNYTVFSVEEVDLTHKLITEADVSEVAKCDLKKLKINCSLQKYRFANLGGYYIVVATSLYHGKWLHEILRYLPNLRTLVFEQANRTTFPTLSRTFHQMKSLNVSCDTLYDMKGISYFINLETLIMRNLTVYRQDDFHELFKLQNLRNLDLSRYKKRRDGECKTIEFMVKADEILPKLEYINCSYLHITAVQLGELLMRNNTIQKICLFGTDCENIGDIEGVTVLTSVDLRASLKLLHHFHEQEQFSMMDRVFEKIKQFFLDGMDYNENQELLTTCFKTFVNHIDNTTPTEALARTDVCSAIKCLVTYCTLYNENVTQTQRSQIAQILLESPTEGFKCYWELFTGAKLHTVQTINALYPKLDEQSRRQITEIPSLLPVFDLIFVECSELVEIWNGRRPLNNVYHLFDLVCTALRNIISGWDLRPEEYEQLHLSLLEVFAQNPNHPIMVNSLTGLIEIVRNRMH